MSALSAADLKKLRAAQRAAVPEARYEIGGIKIPALGIAGDDPAPRILPRHQEMILVQRYDPNMSNVIETIRDDLANGVGGIWLTGADKRISEIIEAIREQKPEIYLDESSVEIKKCVPPDRERQNLARRRAGRDHCKKPAAARDTKRSLRAQG